MKKFIFEGECLKVVRALNGHSNEQELKGENVVNSDTFIIARNPLWKVSHVNRFANKGAHNLAPWASCISFMGSIPLPLVSPLYLVIEKAL